MSIKVIDEETFKGLKKPLKKSIFLEDIKNIYANRVEYAEFVDYPYARSTIPQDVIGHAQKYLAYEFYKLTGKRIDYREMPFEMTKVKDKDKNIRIYCAFHVNVWDEMVRKAQQE